MLAVLLFGPLCVLGIVLGWVFCHLLGGERTLIECLYLGVLSGITAFLSLQWWQWYFRVDDAYSALSARLLISLVLVSSFIATVIRFMVFYLSDPETPFLSVFLIGFVGDVIGTFLVLYLLRISLMLRRAF